MSVEATPSQYESQTEPTEAERIVQSMTAKEYLYSEAARLTNEWGNQSLELFKFTGEVLKS